MTDYIEIFETSGEFDNMEGSLDNFAVFDFDEEYFYCEECEAEIYLSDGEDQVEYECPDCEHINIREEGL